MSKRNAIPAIKNAPCGLHCHLPAGPLRQRHPRRHEEPAFGADVDIGGRAEKAHRDGSGDEKRNGANGSEYPVRPRLDSEQTQSGAEQNEAEGGGRGNRNWLGDAGGKWRRAAKPADEHDRAQTSCRQAAQPARSAEEGFHRNCVCHKIDFRRVFDELKNESTPGSIMYSSGVGKSLQRCRFRRTR